MSTPHHVKDEMTDIINKLSQHVLAPSVIETIVEHLIDNGYTNIKQAWTEGIAPLDTELRYSLLEDSETPKDYAVNEVVTDIRRANIMTDIPMVRNTAFHYPDHDQHYLVLDIDHPAQLIESSTPGHYHLIIEKKMNKFEWINVLIALSHAGIVQPGYAWASINAGYTSIRLPWVRKGFKTDQPLDGHPVDVNGMSLKTWADHDAARKGTILEKPKPKKTKGKSLRDMAQPHPDDQEEGW